VTLPPSVDAPPALLTGTRLLAVDVETTGWSTDEGHEVIEIGWVAIENGALGPTWSSLVRPRRMVTAGAREIHGIGEAMLAGAPELGEVATAFRRACDGLTLVFHNAGFDVPFIQRLMREAGLEPLFNPVIDTLGLARGLFGSGNNSLGELRVQLGLPEEQAHRALGDARTTARAFLMLARRWESERGVTSLAELAAVSQDAVRLTPRRAPGAAPAESGALRF
jgi:DNA polymerase III epsilon subunit family exonuclease